MKGLLLKDLFALRKQGKIVLLLVLFYLFYSILSKNVSMLSAMITMLCAFLPITTMSYDEMCKWDRYALSMPISRKTVVYSKYLFGVLLILACILTLTPISAFIVNYTGEMNTWSAFRMILAMGGIAAVFLALIMPLLFKFGVEKARLLMFLLIFIPVAAGYGITKLGIKMPDKNILDLLTYLSPLFVLVIVCISIAISVKIYTRKEF